MIWILEDSGHSPVRIIDVTLFLTNMKDDLDIQNRLWKEYFEQGPSSRTPSGINGRPTPSLLAGRRSSSEVAAPRFIIRRVVMAPGGRTATSS
ncbi:MAG TPA: hypothetical protein PL010_10700 [Flavobacteriales bacterium]|nr:hypothetical protein [Flavobacteriales bacterium]HNA33994.1 hypothetical protein [Flavobacteriales bacterium]HNI05096.1 hypothetical protein [Flavobacteriales bacterium]HNK68702.1 hypothetical protein [Flavobacteriales bacterium]